MEQAESSREGRLAALAHADRARLLTGIRQWWLLATAGERDVPTPAAMGASLATLVAGLAAEPGDLDAALDLAAALAPYWLAHGEWSEAETWIDRLLKENRGRAERRSVLARTWSLIARNRGEVGLAADCSRRALEFARAGDDRALVASALMTAASVNVVANDLVEAERLGSEAVATARELYDPQLVSRALQTLAEIYLAAGDFARSRDTYESVLAVEAESANASASVASLLGNVATCCYYQRDYDAASAYAERALERAREEGSRVAEAWALHRIASIGWRLDDGVRAAPSAERAFDIALAIGFNAILVRALEEFAAWLARRGDAHVAAELLASSDAAREALHAPYAPYEEADRAERDRAIDAALGHAARAAARANGEALSLPVAVARARNMMRGLTKDGA